MAVEVFMPKAGMDMQEGKIVNWLKNVGDKVAEGDGLLEIETDKVTMEVESPASGILLCKYFENGDTVPVVTTIGYIGAEGESVPDGPSAAGGEVKAADNVAVGQPAITQNTASVEKAVETVIREGYITATPYAKKLAVENGIDLHTVEPTGSMGEVKGRDVKSKINEVPEKESINATPLAQRIANDKGIDVSGLNGSGYNNKVMKNDVLGVAAPEIAPVVTSAPAKPAPKPVVEGQKRVKLVGMRKVVATRMLQAHTEIPPVTHNMRIDVTELMEFRRKLNEGREEKFSINDFVLKAVAKVLSKNKHMLVSIEGDELVYNDHVNLGMAVALDDGLIVPVIKDADKMGLEALSAAAKDLATRAREGKLAMPEYKGSTFTISNLGMFGIESFTPIINQPDSGILGVCAILDELAMIEGQVVVRKKLGISFTHDHRTIDGMPAAKFMMALKTLLEKPMDVLL